ncbi:hypothetical protein ATN84_20120 [Paramesorhizobium deserti]|uniref:Glycosyltransferase n=1 Tax=Paramesorhizobium deserti TaxID=1494590 RepID=A0A135HPA4_9HYPH|nr:hypothetical protein [Paramesorhizobium deserti]KXF75000.1 hypothetical protein ATN84_20120 [Paramesorhizobium deserti]
MFSKLKGIIPARVKDATKHKESAPAVGTRIAFSIPGEPEDGFLSQIALFDLALRQMSQPLRDARVIAHLRGGEATVVPLRWRPHLKNVELRFIKPAPDQKPAYATQAMDRFRINEPDLDVVILCDADTLLLGGIDDVLRQLALGTPVAGVIAHFPPPDFQDPNQDWRDLSKRIIGSSVTLLHPYTLVDPNLVQGQDRPLAPFYLNHGFLAFRADALKEFSRRYIDMRARVAGHMTKYPQFVGQVSLTLTQHELGWKPAALPMRYNFPNDARALDLHKYEAGDIRVLHYLRERSYKRNELSSSDTAFYRFMKLELDAADRIVQSALQRITGGEYPF